MKQAAAILFFCGIAYGQIFMPTGQVVAPLTITAHNANYLILAADMGGQLTTNTTATYTIPQAGTTGFSAKKWIIVSNVGSGTLTLSTSTSIFYGMGFSGTTVSLGAGQAAQLTSDGTNWNALAFGVGSGSAISPCSVSSSGITCPGPLQSGGTNAGVISLQPQTQTLGSVAANAVGLVSPASVTGQHFVAPPATAAAAHQVWIFGAESGGITGPVYKTIPDCQDTGGNHLNFTQSTDAFSCGTSGGGGGSVTISANGTLLGPFTNLNMVPGFGVLNVPTLVGSTAAQQLLIDTAVIPSKANLQGGTNPQICSTTSDAGGTAYVVTCATALSAYANKQFFRWVSGNANTIPNPTMNVDTLGPKPMVRQNGSTFSLGDIALNTEYTAWNDGTNIHVVEAGLGGGGGGGAIAPISMGNTGSISETGSDVTVFTTSSLPAIATGACKTVYASVFVAQGGTALKVFVDSTLLATPIASSAGPEQEQFEFLYCNNASSQTVQTITYKANAVCSGSLGSLCSWTPFVPSYIAVPSSFNWASGHTISVKSNAGSGTVQGLALWIAQ